MARPLGGVDGRGAAVVGEAVRRGGRPGRPRTPRTAKDDGQLGTVSAAGSRPNSREHSLFGEGSRPKARDLRLKARDLRPKARNLRPKARDFRPK